VHEMHVAAQGDGGTLSGYVPYVRRRKGSAEGAPLLREMCTTQERKDLPGDERHPEPLAQVDRTREDWE